MTLLQVCKDVAVVIGLAVPSAVMAATDRELVELAAVANEAAKRIAEEYDWQSLKKIATITGTGALQDFSLPSDYFRMIKTAKLWPSAQPNNPLSYVTDSNDWLEMTVENFSTVVSMWTLFGDQVHIRPAPANSSTIQYFYVSNLLVTPAGGGTPTVNFVNDGDTFRLNERLLTLAMIWQWRANKGLAYGEDMENYQTALAERIASDRGARVLTTGRSRMPAGATLAWPGVITP